MTILTRWKMVEIPVRREEAAAVARSALAKGAVGAVTSWGSGISHRETLRIFWDASDPNLAENLGAELAKAEDLAEEDWRAHWRESLSPFHAGRFTLAPAWEKHQPDSGEVIFIDPGMAFGAGDHPTTRLCVGALETLRAAAPPPLPVLDAGTGTGVLAIAAAKLGLSPVTALDIDPFCRASCTRNVVRNRVEKDVSALLLSLDLLEGQFGLALANVAPRQLVAMSGILADKVRQGGLLLISGFQEDSEARVLAAYDDEFALSWKREEDGWLALLLNKR